MIRPPLPDRSFPRLAGCLPVVACMVAAACSGDEGAGSAGRETPPAGAQRPAADVGRDPAWRGVALDTPVDMPSVSLIDTGGRPYRLRDEARGRVTLLFLGYTHCPDVCPVQMANLGAALDGLAPSLRRHVRVVFVTVDPARDSAARIRAWLDRFGEGFVGLRGGREEIAALQDSLRLPRAAPQQREVEGRYTVGHDSRVLAFGPGGRARLAYPSGTRQRDWRHDLPRLVREAMAEGASGGG